MTIFVARFLILFLLAISKTQALLGSSSSSRTIITKKTSTILSQTNHQQDNDEVLDSDIIIVGGGLVGMATGVALSERGITSCQVYEQARSLRKVGAAIGLYPNGLTALEYISPSILEKVLKNSSPCNVFERRDTNNEVVQITNVTTIQATAPVMYAWYLLQEHFAGALPPNCLRLGHAIESYRILDNGLVQVSFQKRTDSSGDDGRTTSSTTHIIHKTCRLLVGADGIHSQVRKQMLGGPPSTINYYKKVMYRAVLDKNQVDKIIEIPDGCQISWQGTIKGKSFSLRETTAGIITVTAAALSDPPDNTSEPDPSQLSSKKQRLQFYFSEFPTCVHNIIDQFSDDENIHEDYLRDINIPDEWTDDGQSGNEDAKVVIIGDAVHAMTPNMGQGANQGLEDVCELVECIVKQRPLQQYVNARLNRVKEIQDRSAQNTIQSNTFDKQTASIPFERRKHPKEFITRLYNWKPTSTSES